MERKKMLFRGEDHNDQLGFIGLAHMFHFLLPTTKMGIKRNRLSEKKLPLAWDTKRWKSLLPRQLERSVQTMRFLQFRGHQSPRLYTTLLLKWWLKLFDDPTRKWATLVPHNYHPTKGWWLDQGLLERFVRRQGHLLLRICEGDEGKPRSFGKTNGA